MSTQTNDSDLRQIQEQVIPEIIEERCKYEHSDDKVQEAVFTSLEYYYNFKRHNDSDIYFPVVLATATYNTLSRLFNCPEITIDAVAKKYAVDRKKVQTKTLDMMEYKYNEWQDTMPQIKVDLMKHRSIE